MEKAEILIRVLEPEIDAKCAEIRQKKSERLLTKVFIAAAAIMLIIPALLIFFGVSLFTVFIPIIFIGAPEKLCKDIPYEALDMMSEGKRVIFAGLCRGEVTPENIDIIGMIVISDKVRKNAKETVNYFYSQGIDVKVISGDSANAAAAIAKIAGIKMPGYMLT